MQEGDVAGQQGRLGANLADALVDDRHHMIEHCRRAERSLGGQRREAVGATAGGVDQVGDHRAGARATGHGGQ